MCLFLSPYKGLHTITDGEFVSVDLGRRVLTLTVYRDQKEGVGAFFEKRKPNFKATLEEDGPVNFPWWTEIDTGSRPKAGKKGSKL
jgi:hypothetical protein